MLNKQGKERKLTGFKSLDATSNMNLWLEPGDYLVAYHGDKPVSFEGSAKSFAKDKNCNPRDWIENKDPLSIIDYDAWTNSDQGKQLQKYGKYGDQLLKEIGLKGAKTPKANINSNNVCLIYQASPQLIGKVFIFSDFINQKKPEESVKKAIYKVLKDKNHSLLDERTLKSTGGFKRVKPDSVTQEELASKASKVLKYSKTLQANKISKEALVKQQKLQQLELF